MSNIKIFISHMPNSNCLTIDSPLYVDVQCGAASSGKNNQVMPGDDTGVNISGKFETYRELTVQYWAWKNEEADYYGLYRDDAYLLLHSDISADFRNTNCYIEAPFGKDTIKKHKLDLTEEVENIVKEYDILVCKPRKLEHYQNLEAAIRAREYEIEGKTLDNCLRILKNKFPKMLEHANKYLGGYYEFSGNLFTMSKKAFNELCEFQFSILFEMEKILDISKLSVDNLKIFEKIGKFLLGVFIYSKLNGDSLKIGMPYYLKFSCQSIMQAHHKPAFDTGNIAVVLSSSDFFASYLGVCIKSIILTSSPDNNYDIIVVERGITDKNKERIRAISSGHSNVSIRFLNVTQQIKDANFYINSDRISQETYYGLLTPWFLPDYQKVIIMDCDMILKRDIADLYNIPLNDNIGGGVNDIVLQGWLNDPNNDTYNYYTNDLHITNPFKCFNGGLVLLDMEKYRNTFTWVEVINYINKYKLRVVDQDIFNILLEGRALLLDVRWNHMIYLKGAISNAIGNAPAAAQKLYFESQKGPFIIHYASENKPWLNPRLEFADDFWTVARQTVFYEMILERMMDKKLSSIQVLAAASVTDTVDNRSSVRKFADKVLPHGSRRRAFAKKILPKGSYMWRFCKQIYFIFHPEYRIQNKRARHER